MLLLELSDINLRLSRAGEVLYQQPGAAYVEHKQLTYGRDALDVVKLHPNRVHTQYWRSMDQSAVEPKGFGVSTQIDLVYRQLVQIQEQAKLSLTDKVWFAVPGDLSDQQLGLLYGSSLKAGVQLGDFIDYGVLVGSTVDIDGPLAFIDIGLQRTVITRLVLDQDIRRESVSVDAQLGLLPLMNTWIRLVAENFLDISRFDPRKFAETEQQVFLQILDFIQSDDEHRAIEAEYRSNKRQVEVSRNELIEVGVERLNSTLSYLNGCKHVVLMENGNRFPGFARHLQQNGWQVHQRKLTEVHDFFDSYDLTETGAESSGRKFYTHLNRVRTGRAKIEPVSSPVDTKRATHLLHEFAARPIGQNLTVECGTGSARQVCFELSYEGEELLLIPNGATALTVNGQTIQTALVVHCGDLIKVSDEEYQLIEVL